VTVFDMTDPEDRRKSFEAECKEYRRQILILGDLVKDLRSHSALMLEPNWEAPDLERNNEMRDNLILAYRHLEDARMRLGKAIQASDGGASLYKD
jgi:hypothetical protein